MDIPKEALIVEDEPLVRIVAADAITDSGVMAWEAGNAAEALEALDNRPHIGLVVTDVNMPGEMDGLALAEKVAYERPDITVIITSGDVEVQAHQLPEGGYFLPKPYAPRTLANLVQEKLDQS